MASKPVKIALTKLSAMLKNMAINCNELSVQAGPFKDDTLNHNIKIMSGIIHSTWRRVTENESSYLSTFKKGD